MGIGIWFGLVVAVGLIFGFGSVENEEFQPQNEFRLDAWVPITIAGIDMSINKAVAYLFLAAGATCALMVWIARRMQAKPNRVQTIVELAYDLTHNTITRANMDVRMTAKWFTFTATLFFFIWFSNIIGFIPLPINTEHPVNVLGIEVPAMALYAATANLSVPLVLTLVVWVGYHIEGVRAKGFRAYIASWIPGGIEGPIKIPIFMIEVLSQLVRLVSLTARLFANMLAGHLLILIMAGGMAILLTMELIAVATMPIGVAFYIFEIALVASLQAFIFSILTAIYFGQATAEEH